MYGWHSIILLQESRLWLENPQSRDGLALWDDIKKIQGSINEDQQPAPVDEYPAEAILFSPEDNPGR